MFRRRPALATLALLCSAAAPAEPVTPCATEPAQAVAAVNALRAQARRCGAADWPAARPLGWNLQLAESAQRYAVELARRDEISHVGAAAASASLRTRLHSAGYVMRLSAENLAGGPESLGEALSLWLASPAHCENLMLAELREMGLACVVGPGKLQRYWVLHLGVKSSPDQSP